MSQHFDPTIQDPTNLLRLLRLEIFVRGHRSRTAVFLLQTDRPRLTSRGVIGTIWGRSGVPVGRRDDGEPIPRGFHLKSPSKSTLRVKIQPAHGSTSRALVAHRADGEAPALGPIETSLARLQCGHGMGV